MKKTFAVFVAVATIAGSLATTPASAQRGKDAGASPTGSYPGPGPYDFGDCKWVTQRFWDGNSWRIRRVRVCF
jgi:hypothetical protein